MVKKSFLINVLAILSFAITNFVSCELDAGSESGQTAARDANLLNRYASFTNEQPNVLNDTVWFAQLTNTGVARLDFTGASTATGVFANDDHTFTYTLSGTSGVLTESAISTSWNFVVNPNNNKIGFPNGFAPYGTNTDSFYRIEIQSYISDVTDIGNTLWIGRGPRGESLLDVTSYSTSSKDGVISGTFGSDPTNSFDFTYTGYTSTGSGTMDGAGDFDVLASNATMTFPDFWGHDEEVVFQLYVYAQ